MKRITSILGFAPHRGRRVRKKTSWKLYILLALLIAWLTACNQESATRTNTPNSNDVVSSHQIPVSPARSLPAIDRETRVLILHDSAGPWGYIGKEHAMLLENLLGHFDVSIRTQPVSLYTAGQINNFDATFYLGTTYDEPSFYPEDSVERSRYAHFLQDVINTSATVVWMNHNLWQLAWNWPIDSGLDSFESRFGFKYNGLVDLKYNRVMYQGTELGKAVVHFANPGAVLDGCFEEASGQYACAPELNKTKVTDNSRAKVRASAYSTIEAEAGYTPYIVQSGNFWFVGDLPFLHHSIRDRYLAFADLLFDMLAIEPERTEPTALIRLDNIHPASDPDKLSKTLNYLQAENIAYAVAVTPSFVNNRYADQNQDMGSGEISTLLEQHNRTGLMSVVAHGLSHQWEGGDNPKSGMTGDDYEFYRVTANHDLSHNWLSALVDDQTSAERTSERLNISKATLESFGLTPFAWKAPYDMAGEADFLIAQELFPVYYGRVHYYSPQGPEGRFVGQMFPWLIQRDRYDYRVIAENLGSIRSDVDVGYAATGADNILQNARYLAVVRDHLASFSFDINEPLSELKRVVEGLREEDYQFRAPCLLGFQCSPIQTTQKQLRLSNKNTELYATASTSSLNVALSADSNNNSQRWQVTENDDQTMLLRSAITQKCLALSDTSSVIEQAICNASDIRQRWKVYGQEVRNRATGQCLDKNLADDSLVIKSCDNSATQQWQIHWIPAE